jgi:hypothetical protein
VINTRKSKVQCSDEMTSRFFFTREQVGKRCTWWDDSVPIPVPRSDPPCPHLPKCVLLASEEYQDSSIRCRLALLNNSRDWTLYAQTQKRRARQKVAKKLPDSVSLTTGYVHRTKIQNW